MAARVSKRTIFVRVTKDTTNWYKNGGIYRVFPTLKKTYHNHYSNKHNAICYEAGVRCNGIDIYDCVPLQASELGFILNVQDFQDLSEMTQNQILKDYNNRINS